MAGFLFHDIIFGPVRSRRLGISLGINPLSVDKKLCTFNCIYCECGWTDKHNAGKRELPGRNTIREYLEQKLIELKDSEITPDSLTFAGNGEPSIHPDFHGIIDDTIELRDKHFPQALITVLSNSTTLHKDEVFEALKKVDQNILKLDAGTEDTYRKINQVQTKTRLKDVVENLQKFNGKLIVQTLFLRGKFKDEIVDNTTEEEISLWLGYLDKIRPEYVMIYPIDRSTPAEDLEKVPSEELEAIAERVNDLGIRTRIYE